MPWNTRQSVNSEQGRVPATPYRQEQYHALLRLFTIEELRDTALAWLVIVQMTINLPTSTAP